MTDIASGNEQVAELTRELTELRGRQEGVADILRALSTSGMRLQPILDQIVETAARLCRADSGFLYLADGALLGMRANFGQPAEVVEYERLHPDRPGAHSCTGRVALTRRPVHIPDVHADSDYTYSGVEFGHYRTLLGLPVLFDEELLGVIGLSRAEVRPFADGKSSS
jgi:two-component system, NtrC family, sensor kinase